MKIDAGEEVVAALERFAAEESVRAGAISAIGSASDVELGCFVRSTREYVRRTFAGEWEIGSLIGNFSELDGRPFPHCHAVIGGSDFAAHTGHLFRAHVTMTCEAQIVTDPGFLRRVRRADLGFNPLELGAPRAFTV